MPIKRMIRKSKLSNMTEGERREYKRAYQRKWYANHREQMCAYQRDYNAKYKRKQHRGPARNAIQEQREPKRLVYKTWDLQNVPVNKLVSVLDDVRRGNRVLVR